MKYISILRGINVGGHKKIKMADLKALYVALNFKAVETYIQSGNVIFESSSSDVSTLKSTIEIAISEEFGFDVPVLIRSVQDWKQVMDNCPFLPVDLNVDGTNVLVTFLSEPPETERILVVKALVKPPEELHILGREVYLHCPNGYGNTKLSNPLLERKLAVEATTRNWKSVVKLAEMSSD